VLAVQVKEKDLVCLRPGGHEISVTESDQLAALRTNNSIRIADLVRVALAIPAAC